MAFYFIFHLGKGSVAYELYEKSYGRHGYHLGEGGVPPEATGALPKIVSSSPVLSSRVCSDKMHSASVTLSELCRGLG